jgi:hypothetical protein
MFCSDSKIKPRSAAYGGTDTVFSYVCYTLAVLERGIPPRFINRIPGQVGHM